MSGSTPGKSDPAEEPRSLRNRIFEIFRSSPPPGRSTPSEAVESHEGPHHLCSAEESASQAPDVHTRLLQSYARRESVCGLNHCTHGTFSPKPLTEAEDGYGDEYQSGPGTPRTGFGDIQFPADRIDSVLDSQEISPAKRLALEHGVKNRRVM